ncbi:hypothetical protein ACFQMA_15885 [Halosimplex aquaticum]|uniref:DUF1648 domain-containing protein n=1 Tax=Halosimplex aquaticum TaxID=3026162 RepID=A0ABD5Y6D0_9EURY|nr:hypothetical protein [Halosimplex aquaticum]
MSASVARGLRPRWTDVTALALVALTVAVAAAALPRLPAEMVVGWHVGLDGRLSRTIGPRVLGVALLPALSVASYAALRTARALVSLDTPRDRRLYDALVHLLLASLCACQVAVVAANLG